jgi:glucokinase
MGSDSNGKYWLGFDLGGTKMMALALDADFKIRGSSRAKTRGSEGAKEGLSRIVDTIEEALKEADIKRQQLGGVGVGFPGPLDLERGVILQAPNLGWQNVPLKETLEKTFDCPAIIANDVDAGTYGEYRFGAAQKARCVVGVFPGTGIGGACVYEGRILRGKTSSCMEIGHLQVQPRGRVCGCGQRGCLEAVASRLAISAEAAMAVYRGEAPHLREIAGTDIAEMKSGALARAIKAGDSVIERIVRNAAEHLGIALANVVNLLAPDIVVLGGGMVEAMKDLFLDEIRKVVDNRAMKSFTKSLKIVAAELGDNATALGAAAMAAEADRKEK